MGCRHTQSSHKPLMFKQTASSQKQMASVFWDSKGALLVKFMPRNTNAYCATLERLFRAIQNRRRGKLLRGTVLLHDNTRPHNQAATWYEESIYKLVPRYEKYLNVKENYVE